MSNQRGENIHECLKLKSPLGVKWHNAITYVNSCLFVVVLVILIGCYIAISRYIHKSSRQFISQSNRRRNTTRALEWLWLCCSLPVFYPITCVSSLYFQSLGQTFRWHTKSCITAKKWHFSCLRAMCAWTQSFTFSCVAHFQEGYSKIKHQNRSESIRSLQSVRRSEGPHILWLYWRVGIQGHQTHSCLSVCTKCK